MIDVALGDIKGAELRFQKVIELQPRLAHAHYNLAKTLADQGRYEEAAINYRNAIRLRPYNADCHINLGYVYAEQGKLEKADECFRDALRLNPHSPTAHYNLGNVLRKQGCLDEAVAHYSEALRLKPYFATAHSNLLFCLNYMPNHDAQTIFAEHVRWGGIHGQAVWPTPAHVNIPDPERRLRIGYVSGDFRNHPVGFFMEGVLAHHDKMQYEVFCYANNVKDDDLTDRVRHHASHWRDVAGQSDESLTQQVRRDQIDILVDLSGHTADNRLLAFAHKPAPIQATWLGYVATTGLKAIDYIMADRFVIPPQEERFYVERVVRLAGSYLCFTPPAFPLEVLPLPALSQGGVTLGCFNNLSKLTPEVVTVWAEILRALPAARLFMKNKSFGDEAVRARYREHFAGHGVSAERLMFSGQSPRAELLAAYHEVDIALDPFPYNGGTTTCEALWMGVPVIALRGGCFVGHVGESILNAVGLDELVAESEAEYVSTAIALASDHAHLAGLRAGLRERFLRSPVGDCETFTRSLEGAYRKMWRSWCGGQGEKL